MLCHIACIRVIVCTYNTSWKSGGPGSSSGRGVLSLDLEYQDEFSIYVTGVFVL